MAGAGMCTAGRILHHLRHNLSNPQAHVLIVGYQARGSLGRMLVDGARKVHIFGDSIAVHAQIHSLGGFSAHAGQTDLLKWLEYIAPVKPRVILTHGENKPRTVAGRADQAAVWARAAAAEFARSHRPRCARKSLINRRDGRSAPIGV